jgi:hypothetical protein
MNSLWPKKTPDREFGSIDGGTTLKIISSKRKPVLDKAIQASTCTTALVVLRYGSFSSRMSPVLYSLQLGQRPTSCLESMVSSLSGVRDIMSNIICYLLEDAVHREL